MLQGRNDLTITALAFAGYRIRAAVSASSRTRPTDVHDEVIASGARRSTRPAYLSRTSSTDYSAQDQHHASARPKASASSPWTTRWRSALRITSSDSTRSRLRRLWEFLRPGRPLHPRSIIFLLASTAVSLTTTVRADVLRRSHDQLTARVPPRAADSSAGGSKHSWRV